MRYLLLSLLTLLFSLSISAQITVGEIKNTELLPKAIVAYGSSGKIIFSAHPSDIIQTTIETSSYQGDQISNAVITKSAFRPQLIQNDETTLLFINGKQRVRVDKKKGSVQYIQQQSSITLNGLETDSQFRKLSFGIKKEESFFGGGSRSIPINKYGYKIDLNNNPWYGYNINADNLNYSIPFIQSKEGYALFFDNPSKGYFDIGKSNADRLEAGFVSGKLDFYTFFGGSPAVLIEKFTFLVGRMPMPARWVLGNFMSRFGYRSQEEVLDIANKMKTQQFPVDAAIIDLFWFGDGVHGAWNMGDLDWNLKRFPEPQKMIDSLRKMQIKTILITEPFVLSESKNYVYTQKEKLNAVDKKGDTIGIKEFWFGYSGLLDLFKNKSKDWFWQHYDRQIKKGVAGWWGDLGEPEKHPNYIYHNLQDYGKKRLYNADEVHNIYGHIWSEMLFEKYKKYYPSERLFHLNRSGYAGTWRYGSFPWSGDVERSWKGFQAQLPVMLSMGMSGVPTMHSDAGGFAMGERDPELYRRWIQMAVFSPIFRPHGSVNAPDPKIPQIESEPVFYDDPEKSILRNFIELRYRLMPYIYNVAFASTQTGAPFVRSLFYNDTTDVNLYKATDQYYFGSSLMVAPVLEKGAEKRKLYLPRGAWYDFWNPLQKIIGGRWLEVNVTADKIPVYVKAGSVIAMKPTFRNTQDYPTDIIELHYYPEEGSHTISMYEDDGISAHSLKDKAYEMIRIHLQTKKNDHSIRLGSNNTKYKGKPISREVKWVIHGQSSAPSMVEMNGKAYTNYFINNSLLQITVKDWRDESVLLRVK
jgi:oligosaccharide 4-alpha-D-glucosyltransferase